MSTASAASAWRTSAQTSKRTSRPRSMKSKMSSPASGCPSSVAHTMRSGVISSTRMESAPRSGSITVNVMFFFRLSSGPASWRTSNGMALARLRRKTSRSPDALEKPPAMSAQ
jgi:hypothetical protein